MRVWPWVMRAHPNRLVLPTGLGSWMAVGLQDTVHVLTSYRKIVPWLEL